MDDRRMQFRVGAVVVATLVIGGLLIALNGPAPQAWMPWAKGKYRITIELDQAPGIAPNTPVRKNGLLIGRVASVKDMDDRVLVRANIDEGIRLYPQYVCQVRTTVLGDSTIDFSSRSVPPNTVPLQDGAVVQGSVLANPIEMIGNLQGELSVTISSLGRAGDEVAQLAQSINQALGDQESQQRLFEMMDRAVVALDAFSTTMQSIEDISADPVLRQQLEQGLTELPAAIRDVRTTMRDAGEVLKSVDKVVVSAEANLRNLEGLTEPLGQSGERLINAVLATVDSVDRLMEEINVFGRSISSSTGTIGRLIHDRELYDNMNNLALNANTLIWQLNERVKELRPILYDARIFTDKVAREPGRLIRGALNQGPAIK